MKVQFASDAYKAVRTAYKDSTLKKLYPSRYLAAAKKPVKACSIVFLEVREKELSDNFRLIKAALEHRNQAERYHYTFDTVCIREGMENPAASSSKCLAAIPKIAQAEFIFVSESSYFLSSLPIRKESTVIQTWHACGAFKKFGYSTVGKGFGTTLSDLEEYPVHKNFSYVTVSSDEVTWAYAEAFHMEDRIQDILATGVSRTDLYFHPRVRKNAALRIRKALVKQNPALGEDLLTDILRPERSSADGTQGKGPDLGAFSDRSDEQALPGKKLILYAPTYRGSVRHASSPDRLDLAVMKAELGDDCLLLIKQHPFVKKKAEIPKDLRDFAYDVSDQRIEDLIMASDLLITDYSSIVFEYSLFEKPMVFFAFDLEDYEKQRGFYYPVREMMPGPVCMTTHDVTREIRRTGRDFDLMRVRAFKYRFMGSCDGHATSRILKLMDEVSARKGSPGL